MNVQVEEKLNEMLVKAMSALDTGAEFMAGEIPVIISELLLWHALESFLEFLCAIVTMVVLFIVKRRTFKHITEEGVLPILWIGFITSVAFCVAWLAHSIVWLKIWVAPKLYLFEYAASLVK